MASNTGAPSPTGQDDSSLSTVDWVLAILCSGIGCIVGIVYMIQGKPKGGKLIGISLLFGVLWAIVQFAFTALQQGGP